MLLKIKRWPDNRGSTIYGTVYRESFAKENFCDMSIVTVFTRNIHKFSDSVKHFW